ncbi:immunoglobulin superfamily containing leucine-rich repeat protein-like isoform X2 [Rhineura floridana]|uniref:immunoglobulin superfamily containing leucine-rich repeat protein-like isoform X2 n=1 Tax=Rhineura floridana TaxID=261503 RepID=UPI002AC7FD02|nr:immunoglobulin superfamily containing leucine-rich repeat protein-like isoform X2 [Rhineura floridana]
MASAKGGEAMGPWFCLLAALLFMGTQSCPEVCNCVAKKKYGRHIADCSYRELQAVPLGLPSNATTLTLSVNHITSLQADSFVDLTDLQALWLSYNEIGAIADGTFAFLVQLRAIDVSYNQIVDFPWGDLSNLTTLQLLKLSSNRLEKVPPEAFRTLKDLRSLWLSGNKLAVLSEGTFDSMLLLSQLQINHNPFNCSCKAWWLKRWLEDTSVSVPEKESITCAAPDKLKGLILGRSLKLDCMIPSVQLAYHSSLGNSVLHDRLILRLHCSAVGKPPPEIRWKIQTSTQNVVINGPNVGEGGNWLSEGNSEQSKGRFLVFKNGSMAISEFSKEDEGIYTCQALNDVGSREASVNVALAGSENPAEGFLQNNIQASKPRTKACDKEELLKPDEKVVLIYLTPIAPKASSNGGTLWESWAWARLFLVLLLALYS